MLLIKWDRFERYIDKGSGGGNVCVDILYDRCSYGTQTQSGNKEGTGVPYDGCGIGYFIDGADDNRIGEDTDNGTRVYLVLGITFDADGYCTGVAIPYGEW